MEKQKLTRQQIHSLWVALNVCKSLEVGAKFRYVIAKNIRLLEPEIKSTEEAYPEPDRSDKEAVEKWAAEIEPHFKEEVDIELMRTPLIEINDTVHVEEARRHIQNQMIIEALMPIWEE
jgi:hypothetical protein